MVNNPFFQQMPTTGVADVLHMVDRDTKFIDCLKHVLGTQSKCRAHEYDLLAILVANATNQGIYGISQISDRAYDQLRTIQSNYIRLETLNEEIPLCQYHCKRSIKHGVDEVYYLFLK